VKRLELVGGGSKKFWEIEADGAGYTVRFGRIGTTGQTQHKKCDSAAEAKLVVAKLTGEKLRDGYVEVDAATPPELTFAGERKVVDPILKKTELPYTRIHAKKAKQLPLWASKGNGPPYLPKGTKWPRAANREMYPAVQIDFADVPALPGFPRKGMLSLFWTEDHCDWKLLYFPKVIRDEAELETDFAFFNWDQILYPFHPHGQVALTFEARTGCASWGDYRFEELVGKERVGSWLDTDVWDPMWNHVYKWSGHGDSRIGGYASPQQGDPRESKKARKYETLLLQLHNDNFTHEWYIEPAKLARCDFSDVLYHQACD